MKFISSSEWFELDSPIGEPDIKWNNGYKYVIERIINKDGDIIWFGQATNWVKKPNKNWTVLTTNYNAKPLEKYLPEVIYGEDRNYFADCEEPIYEKLYKELQLK